MNINLTGRTIFKLCCLGVLIWLLGFLIVRLMIMGDTIDLITNTNNTFI